MIQPVDAGFNDSNITNETQFEKRASDLASTSLAREPVAVVGMAFRFPGDHGCEDGFWDALRHKHDLVSEIPADRWAVKELCHDTRSEPGRSITFSAGVLSRIDEFDASFFGISPREAAWLDPQQRLLLELSWEAMENAQVPPSSLGGSNCAVYVGISSFDYGTRSLSDLASVSSHMMTGNTLSVAANRLSYVFDLRGPSLAVDTACSSSLVALHHACNSLRSGESSVALVGGVSLLLHPYPFIGFTKASMLSADGRCKVFDESGDGYVRSEGGAVLLLKPLSQAQADGDSIHAVILASGVNADGARKTGITIPSREGQAELMRDVLQRSGLSAADVDFVEAHGTGTAVGDPVETAAIGAVYGQARPQALPIGSVKANLGHLESASGMAGFVKAVLALKNRALPPALHLRTPNPRIDFQRLNLELITEYTPLSREDGRPLTAGVNSFGFGGANAHLLLQEYPLSERAPHALASSGALPLHLSARSEPALRALAGRYAERLQTADERDLYDIAHAVFFRRERMERRLGLMARSASEAAAELSRYAQGENPASVVIEEALDRPGSVAFVYSGNGAQWVGMGRALLTESPRFAELFQEVDAAVQPLAGFSLAAELQADESQSRLDDTVVAQPLLFAIQVAITTVLRENGVEPAAVMGHSVGEVAAAWASGALTLQQAVRVICVRSQEQGRTRGRGRMAAAGVSEAAAQAAILELGLGADVDVAGINSPGNVTLSGSEAGLLRMQQLLDSRGCFFRLLALDYAFHSRQMDEIEGALASRLGDLLPQCSQQARFVSTVTGAALEGESLDAGYWWRNVREPVQFARAMVQLVEAGCRVFVEIGPSAILQRYIRENLAATGQQGRVLSSLRRDDDGSARLTEAVLQAQLLSGTEDLQHGAKKVFFGRPARRVALPSYPWQRERHWHPNTSENLRVTERQRVHPLLGWRLTDAETAWENTLDVLISPWLADHKVGGAVVYPGAAYTEMALAAAREWFGGEHLVVEELDILAPVVFAEEQGRTLRFVLDARDGGFLIKSRQRLSNDDWTLHAAGRILQSSDRLPVPVIVPPAGDAQTFDHARHYALAAALGLDYGPTFCGLASGRVAGQVLEAELAPPTGLDRAGYLCHPAVLDLCFQSLVNFFADEIDAGQGVALLPVKVGRLDVCRVGEVARFRAQVRLRGTRSVLADFELFDSENTLVARIHACRFRAAHFKRSGQAGIAQWQVRPWLQPHPAAGEQAELPGIPELSRLARMGLSASLAERQIWFKETLPLIEALTLSFSWEALRARAEQDPEGWATGLSGSHGRWLVDLMRQEGLLREERGRWTLVEDAGLPAADELWRTLLRSSLQSLPQLAMIGRVGQQLPGLLSGEVDGQALLHALQHVSFAEALYSDDPAYRGVRQVLENVLAHVAESRRSGRRLRILEVAAGFSELPRTLERTLPADGWEYVLAVPDEDLRVRMQAEYQECGNITVVTFAQADLSVQVEPGQAQPSDFDLVILRHTLHRALSPRAVISRARRWLVGNGLLLLAERHPDWSMNFLEGIRADWWHGAVDDAAAPVSSLLPPDGWHALLDEEGFAGTDAFMEPAADGLAEGAYLLFARNPATPAMDLTTDAAERWLLLADDASASVAAQLRLRLEARGQEAHVETAEVATLMAGGRLPEHVVHLRGWHDQPSEAGATVARLLENVQALSGEAESSARLWMVTRGGAPAHVLAVSGASPAQAALWGFGRVLMNECPALTATLIELEGALPVADVLSGLERELLQPDGTSEIVVTADARYSLVLQEAPAGMAAGAANAENRFRLDFHVPGQLRNLVWLPQPERALSAEEVEVRTHAAGLNFRDVMYLMGLLPDEAVENGFAGASLGLEFSGVVSRVGAAVKDVQPGDPVMGFGASCFASHVVTRENAVVRMPRGWSFEAAATVPTVFFTVFYALKHLADLQPGERVLIHGAAGGVGVAAIQLARHLGAEIYATAGSEEKRDFVRLLGADRVFDSRSLAFADDVLAATGGKGVDVVLNSLAGEAMRRSLDVLQPFGRFLELGKRDFFENTSLGLRPFRNNISYFGIDADQLLTGRPDLAARLFREVMALFREEVLSPLPYRSFTADQVVDAFRVMQQARHIGKVVVSLAEARPVVEAPVSRVDEKPFDTQGAWLVTGGLGGFGLETARWLAARGVRALVLAGRRGVATPGAEQAVDALRAQGVKVLAVACDVSDGDAVAGLMSRVQIEMPPLTGVIHAAAVFDDRLISRLDAASVCEVMKTKLEGGWNLHLATLHIPVRHFVVYSSVTTALGNPGQANYVAANAGLEGLAELRRGMGLPVTCVAWGPIADAGYLKRNHDVRESLAQRLGKPPMSAAGALEQLAVALGDGRAQLMPADFDWSVLTRVLPGASTSRFAQLNRSRKDCGPSGESGDIRLLLSDKTPEEATEIVRGLVVQEVAAILCISPDRVELNRSLHDLGMDSLMAVELALGLEQRFRIQLPAMMLNDSPTASNVAARIVERLCSDSTTTDPEPAAGFAADVMRQHGVGLSDEDAQALAEDARRMAQSGARLIA